MALRTLARLTIVSVLALTACSAEYSPEQLVTEQFTVTQQFGEVLTKITDKASAERHKDEVKELVKQINALRREVTALSEEERKACLELAAKRGPELQAALAKNKSELTRIKPDAEIQRVIGLWLDML